MARSRKNSSPSNTPNKSKHNNTTSNNNNSKNNSNNPNNIELSEIVMTVCEEKSSKAAELRSFNLAKELNVISDDKSTDDDEWQEVGRRRRRVATFSAGKKPTLQITVDDVRNELEYWSTSIYCFVLGSHPPSTVLEGVVRKIWKNLSIDIIAFQPNGVCMVRFKNGEDKLKTLQSGPLFFDSKPFIVKDWVPNIKLVKCKPDVVPVWIRLYQLDFKFWGLALPKIVGLVGTPLRCDRATQEKEFLEYARYMVEVKVGHPLLESIEFLDENGVLVEQVVNYEWKPVVCSTCTGIGHDSGSCKRKPRVAEKVLQSVNMSGNQKQLW